MEIAKRKGLLRIIADHMNIGLCCILYIWDKSLVSDSIWSIKFIHKIRTSELQESHQTYGKSITDHGDLHIAPTCCWIGIFSFWREIPKTKEKTGEVGKESSPFCDAQSLNWEYGKRHWKSEVADKNHRQTPTSCEPKKKGSPQHAGCYQLLIKLAFQMRPIEPP